MRRTLPVIVGVYAAGLGGLYADSLYVDYSLYPDQARCSSYHTCILSPDAKLDLPRGDAHRNGFLAYLSVVEVAPDARYLEELRKEEGVRFLDRNEEWGSHLVDITSAKWQDWVVGSLASTAWEKGFGGFFLDTVDSVERLAQVEPGRAAEFDRALVGLVKALRSAYPEARIILNRGFRFLGDLEGVVDGVLVESIYRTYTRNGQGYSYLPVPQETTRALERQVEKMIGAGLPVYGVDYIDPSDSAVVTLTEEALLSLGVVPFLTTPDLQGVISGESRRVARRVLCLYGHDPGEVEGDLMWPEDTTTLLLMQTALEWMGYEVEYHDASAGIPVDLDMDCFCGIILDESLNIPYDLEEAYSEWLIKRVREGKKLVFLGECGFYNETARSRLLRALGIQGDASRSLEPGVPRIVALDPKVMAGELPVAPAFEGFEDLRAPPGATVFLGLELASQDGRRDPRFDAVYSASWGGAVFAPYLLREVSEETSLCGIDPFAFLQQIFPADAFPAPDVTTRDGLRIFYTHIDGDGFSSLSWIESGKTCAEVMYKKVLKDLPWPITVSIIESDVRALQLQQDAAMRQRYEDTARAIFALPNVEPASHSFSHPYVWDAKDTSNMELYDAVNLPLKLQTGYRKIDLRREIGGSIDYIRQALAPADKPPRLFLWSGNCRPSPEALRLVEEAGGENMNGGRTILSKRFPGISGVAPKLVNQDGAIQIYCANQNEFYYTDGWTGPYHNGFSQVIETFEMTDAERRLKPVNVYYHFYSVDRVGALKALQEIYAWCGQRPLRAMTASDYAKLVRDSHRTEILRTGDSSWVFLNQGEHTVYRLPAQAGYPDLERSTGVVGFNVVGNCIYVQTDGSRRVHLQMGDRKPELPYLQTSTAPVRFLREGPSAAMLATGDWAADVEVGGFQPESTMATRIGELRTKVHADQNGVVRASLPARVSCFISP